MQDSLFYSLLNQAIETHAVSVSDEVRTHGETSANAEVRAAWSEYRLVQAAVSAWRAGMPTVDLADRVLAELHPPVGVTPETIVEAGPALTVFVKQSWADFRSPTNRSGMIAISVAALLLLIGTVMISIPHSPTAEVAMRSRGIPHPPADPATQATVASVEWAQRASSAMAEMIVGIPEKSAELVPSAGWDRNWKMRLEPLRRDANAAWESLIDELPMPNRPQS